MLALLFGCTALPLMEGRRSGFDEMSPALQAMQRDDFSNPAMLSVQAGEGSPPCPVSRARLRRWVCARSSATPASCCAS